jgi:GTP-binding nuclear protein Ran
VTWQHFRFGKSDNEKLNKRNITSMSIPTYKVVLLGSGGCGKTAWIRRLVTGDFYKEYQPTVGVEVHPAVFETDEGKVAVNFWDVAGIHALGGLRDGYHFNADAAILFYDLTSASSYQDVRKWYEEFERISPRKPLVLCGTKVDSPEEDQRVTAPTIQRELGCVYFPISALSCYNYEKPVLEILRRLRNSPNLRFVEGFRLARL